MTVLEMIKSKKIVIDQLRMISHDTVDAITSKILQAVKTACLSVSELDVETFLDNSKYVEWNLKSLQLAPKCAIAITKTWYEGTVGNYLDGGREKELLDLINDELVAQGFKVWNLETYWQTMEIGEIRFHYSSR
jgi:hypothetical protein